MKHMWTIIGAVLFSFATQGQGTSQRLLEVSDQRTVSLVFPCAILSVDRGQEKIIIQKSMSSVLRVKADQPFTDTTNLTVITTDGKLYAFLVCYVKAPRLLAIDLSAAPVGVDTAMVALSRRVVEMRNLLFGISVSLNKIRLSLLGVYTTGELIVCKCRIENHSSLSYVIGGARVYSRDAVTMARRAVQERIITPVFSVQPGTVVKQKGVYVFTIILSKPALSVSKKLSIELSETDGERDLSLNISNHYLLNANLLRL